MALTPDDLAAQLRTMREELADEIRAMTPKERRDLRNRTKSSRELVLKAITAIDQSEIVRTAVKKDKEAVHQLLAIDARWFQLERELAAFLNEVSSARLARHRELDVLATQTFALVKQLIRGPGNEHLIPIYEDMRHIRREERRKKGRKTSPDAEETATASE